MDQDEDGCIDFNEFISLMDSEDDFELNNDIFARNLFNDLDKNRDGFLTFDEFILLAEIIPNSLEQMRNDFDAADVEKRGKINSDGILL